VFFHTNRKSGRDPGSNPGLSFFFSFFILTDSAIHYNFDDRRFLSFSDTDIDVVDLLEEEDDDCIEVVGMKPGRMDPGKTHRDKPRTDATGVMLSKRIDSQVSNYRKKGRMSVRQGKREREGE
jgi:hypothetical protein